MKSALFILLKANANAGLRRAASAFSTTRRSLLTLFALMLTVLWTGQTVASVLLRDPYAPDVFRSWVAALLFAWFVWHLLRVAWKRPEQPIEWSDEEEALIVAGPFSAKERLTYRFSVILTSTLPKALLTILVLWPDLSWSSAYGLVAALVGLEMFRMLMDIGTCCLSPSAYRAYRAGIAAALGLTVYLGHAHFAQSIDLASDPVPLSNPAQATAFLQMILQHDVVAVVGSPFLAAADVIATQGTVTSVLAKGAAMAAALALMAWLIGLLEAVSRNVALGRERRLWQTAVTPIQSDVRTDDSDMRLPRIPFFGPLMWRQSRRALRYSGGLVISMTIPGMLLVPMMTIRDPNMAFSLVVAGALFYTFVLLPEALKFDFRLDSDHLCQLKMLPLTPTRVVLGQLATPVVLAAFFQIAIFLSAGIFRSIEPRFIIGAIAFSLPLTVLFVALDNLVFLLYPHRPTQEGFSAFLRTILKFTGKSALIGLFAGAVILWAPCSAAIASALVVPTASVFATGIVLGITALACAAVRCVVSAFHRFDVSLHGIG